MNWIQACDAVVDQGNDDMGCFRVRDGILAIGVQQHFIETSEDGVCLEFPSFSLDRLFETALLSRMIFRSHDTLLVRVAWSGVRRWYQHRRTPLLLLRARMWRESDVTVYRTRAPLLLD